MGAFINDFKVRGKDGEGRGIPHLLLVINTLVLYKVHHV